MFNSTSSILMIRPKNFGMYLKSKQLNNFQKVNSTLNYEALNQKVLIEFENFVKKLLDCGINVITTEDSDELKLQSSIYPNNWFSTHENGEIIIYPMCAENRRLEKFGNALNDIKKNFKYENVFDMSLEESQDRFLEGTGSIVFDRINKIAYAGISERTNEHLFHELCKKLDFTPIIFHPVDELKKPIYHTNVMLSITSDMAIVCLDTIQNIEEKNLLLETFENTHKKIINVSIEQMKHFCCNVLEVHNFKNEKILTMSKNAFDHFSKNQITLIEKYCKIIHSDISNIEQNGGGGTRCMMAEIYLKSNKNLH